MMSSPRPSSPSMRPIDLEITVISAKHLKNVNWRHGDLKPYVVAYLDPDHRSATKPDDAGSTRPVWNEHLVLPIPYPLHHDSPLVLTLEIFHSKPSETPKPLVGTARCQIKDLIDLEDSSAGPSPIRKLELLRLSGRPQGKIRIKMALRERPLAPEPNYLMPSPPPSGYYYSAAPPPRDYGAFTSPPPCNHPIQLQPAHYSYGGYSDPYSGYYSSASGYYSAPPAAISTAAPPTRPPLFDRVSSYGLGPSAPVDYSSGPCNGHKPKGSRMGMGTGLAVGAVAGALGGLALEEGIKYEEGKIAEKLVGDLAARESYSDYRADY